MPAGVRHAVAGIGGILVEMFFRQVHSLKCIVKNIHAAFGEVRSVQVALAVNKSAGQTGVTGSIGGFDHGHCLR